MVNGFYHTSNKLKYFLLLLSAAIISQPIYNLLFHNNNLNILFLFALGLAVMSLNTAIKNNNLIKFGLVLLACYISYLCQIEYGAYGIIIIFSFWYFKDKKTRLLLSQLAILIITALVMQNILWLIFQSFSLLSLLLINKYDESKAGRMKYFFYIFYPAHLLILLILTIQ